MDAYSLYAELIKPSWAPPAWLFGPVWTALYIIIAVSFGYVFYLVTRRRAPFSLAFPFILNIILNLAFVPIQFGRQDTMLALADVVLVLGTLVWALIAAWQILPRSRWVVYANVPYLVWVAFATVLQTSIAVLNSVPR